MSDVDFRALSYLVFGAYLDLAFLVIGSWY